MKMKVVLIYLWMINIVNNVGTESTSTSAPPKNSTGGIAQSDENQKRIVVQIPAAKALVNLLSPTIVKSADVKKFNEHDSKFTTIYKMTCGSTVKAISESVAGNARCMPNENDIVEIMHDDEITAEYCLRIIVCKPGEDNTLCKTDSIRIWFPYSRKEVTATSTKTTGNNFKVNKGEIVVTLDPGCQIVFGKEHHLMHRFQNKPETIRKVLEKYPGFYLQPTFYQRRRPYQGGNQLTFGGSLHKGTKTLESIECNAGCDLGQLFYFKMPANLFIFSLIFVDGAKCEWMKICLKGAQGIAEKSYFCNDVDLLNVYIRYGFVTMPGSQNGAPIRLVKSTDGTDKTNQMKKRPTQIGFDFDGERFSIWSVGRERVTSSKNVNHDGNLILYFSHHDCLIRKKGIMYMGENNGKVYQIDEDKSIKDVSTDRSSFFTYSTAKPRQTLGTIPTEKPTPNVSAVAPVTTTEKRTDTIIIGVAIDTMELKTRTGWLIWMAFIGFFVGSLVALIVSGAIVYMGRRTVYKDWYRGMYKRYGCDASGITGGVTGAAFGSTTTAGGTIGSTTLGTTTGGTTMGGTTMGGTTMGGTTMGGTTTGGTTTGGTSMMGTTGGGTTSGGSSMGGGTSTSATSGADMVTM